MTLAMAGVALAVVAAGLMLSIRGGLYDQRVQGMLLDAARGTAYTQAQFDNADTDNTMATSSLAKATIGSLRQSGSRAVGVLLAWGPETTSFPQRVNPIASDRMLWSVTSEALTASAATGASQVWQPVALTGDSGEVPGILVAAPVTLVSIPYVIVFAYDLATEARTLRLVERIVGVGGATVVGILALVAWLVVHQAARPVAGAARVAERLAGGDFTERLEIRGEDEFARLGAAFNEMADALQGHIEELEELSRVQQRFVADVSHELRTPLATIRLAGEVIHAARGDFPAAVARSAELLVTQIERFDALLADLLEISRFDARAAALDVEPSDLVALVGRVAGELAPLAESRHTQVVLHVPDGQVRATLDTRRVERIVRNLVGNAIEHAEGRDVDVYVAGGEACVALVVRDHGAGMGPEQVARVFDRFWRGDPARARTTGGTGLGLAIAQEDARLHGGMVDAWGAPGRGASFRLMLPRKPGAPAHDAPLPLDPEEPGKDVHDDVPAHIRLPSPSE
ncbi:MAG: HAMP domain-containing histidine kinase [Bifidobacteriaceae bacterium]|jgi:two-component system sensor histidine kinase MtrB|nr:HAMP domain-containing histidine kinase [Bifidobacteriaceae bacterium]